MLVEHGGTVVTFEGGGAATLLPELVPLLDGSRTVDELEEAMGRPVAPPRPPGPRGHPPKHHQVARPPHSESR